MASNSGLMHLGVALGIDFVEVSSRLKHVWDFVRDLGVLS